MVDLWLPSNVSEVTKTPGRVGLHGGHSMIKTPVRGEVPTEEGDQLQKLPEDLLYRRPIHLACRRRTVFKQNICRFENSSVDVL